MFICDVNWNGDLCMDYTCNCHATCTLPQPSATGCYDCVVNAHRNESGACTCNDDWTGAQTALSGPATATTAVTDSAPDHPHTIARNVTRTPTEKTTVSASATETGMDLTAQTTPDSATTPVWAAPDIMPTTCYVCRQRRSQRRHVSAKTTGAT
jgi:hypothetical protein